MVAKKYEYFWETSYPFGEFLKTIFTGYRRKYSLTGNGIYNLIDLNNKIYEVKYTETKTMLKADNHAIDTDKKFIIDTITSNLKTDNFAINGGKFITFPVGSWIAKVEVIKKMKEPS